MGNDSTKNDIKENINKEVPNNQKYEIQKSKNNKINDKAKRKCSLKIDNDNKKKASDENLDNQLKSNLCKENSVDNNEKEEISNKFDEIKARDTVKFLLEDDCSFYRNLIPTIDSLSSDDFKNFFKGNYNYNYHIENDSEIKLLSHKFQNFYYILSEHYKDKKYLEYIKELWLEYPYIEDLKKNGRRKKKLI